MAVLKDGNGGTDQASVGTTSKALRVEVFDSGGLSINGKKTYAASGAFTPGATPTDLVTIFGSATKTVKVQSFKIGTANTAAGSQIFVLSKRSAVTTGGTAGAATAVPLDSADAAATATVNSYTSTAPTAGTALGTIVTKKVASPVVTPATFAGIVEDSDKEMLPTIGNQTKAATLRGVAEGLAINFAAAALVSGQIHTFNVVWTEE